MIFSMMFSAIFTQFTSQKSAPVEETRNEGKSIALKLWRNEERVQELSLKHGLPRSVVNAVWIRISHIAGSFSADRWTAAVNSMTRLSLELSC